MPLRRTVAVECANCLGVNAADFYYREFGRYPFESSVGDWDVTAWQEDWKTMHSNGVARADYGACLTRWKLSFMMERRYA